MMRVLDLFSGIGGFSLGLERTGGFKTVAFCEIDPFCRRVLAKHWPEVPCYEDVRELTAEHLAADGISVDVVCGGFPCQDISVAGKGAGLDGERSGLWTQIARLAGELRPRFLIVENVSALLGRGLDRVLGDLASLGFDAEWHCIPASAVGAPHRRDRFWLVGHPNREREPKSLFDQADSGRPPDWPLRAGSAVADANGEWELQPQGCKPSERGWIGDGGGQVSAAHSDSPRFQRGIARRLRPEQPLPSGCGWWSIEPDVGRVAHGVPSRVDRLRALGNAVVPQIPEIIGNAILASIKQQEAA